MHGIEKCHPIIRSVRKIQPPTKKDPDLCHAHRNQFPNLRNGAVLDAAGYSVRNDVLFRGVITGSRSRVCHQFVTTRIHDRVGLSIWASFFESNHLILNRL